MKTINLELKAEELRFAVQALWYLGCALHKSQLFTERNRGNAYLELATALDRRFQSFVDGAGMGEAHRLDQGDLSEDGDEDISMADVLGTPDVSLRGSANRQALKAAKQKNKAAAAAKVKAAATGTSKWLTLREISNKYKVKENTIMSAIRRGRLKATKKDNRWGADAAVADAWGRTRQGVSGKKLLK